MKIINDLKKEYKIDDIESAFVIYYINTNNIRVKNNILIKSIIKAENDKKIKDITKRLSNCFEKIVLTDLIKLFELLIPEQDKKLNGAFFTPQIITDFMVSEVISSQNITICDPSCGCGAFLIAAAKHMRKMFGIKYVKIIENHLYGADISDYSARRGKLLLSLLALENGEDIHKIRFNIKQADSLKENWELLFPDILRKGGFDVIVGNPPYVKYQDLSHNLRKDLYDNWQTLKSGAYNLYFAFFELGINLLNKNGVLGYITPNNYFTSLSGLNLRKYLTQNKLVKKILDFNHLKIFEVQTYTCITFLSKRSCDTFLYEKIDAKDKLNNDGLKGVKYSTVNLLDLNDRKWRLLRASDQNNIKRIEMLPISLSDLVNIRVGVATCKDTIYFIDGDTLVNGYYIKSYKSQDYLIESDITKPIIKVSDLKSQEDVNCNTRRIIFPYHKINNKVALISEGQLKEKYPECYKYLLAAKEELAGRDKGRTEYLEWYAYARTQGLNFWGRKLLTPTFSAEPRFLLENVYDSLFCNGYAIFEKEDDGLFNGTHVDLDALSKILNSKVMDYYVRNTSVQIEGGYPCYQKNFIEHFRLPVLSPQEIGYLKSENNKGRIDAFLINKYQIAI